MAQEINVLSRTQIIKVDPVSGSIAIINAGPANGADGAPGPPGPPGLSGTQARTIATAEEPIIISFGLMPGTVHDWTEVDIDCYAMIVTRFIIHSTNVSSFMVAVTSQPDGDGEEMLTASGFPSNEMKLSWPWWFNNDNEPREKKLYIGIRNTGPIASTFSITDFRGYSVEDD